MSCRWSGFDDVPGNGDDVVFTLDADTNGSFDLVGVPFGFFTCDGRDPITARQSSAVAAAVFSEAVNASVPRRSRADVAHPRSKCHTPHNRQRHLDQHDCCVPARHVWCRDDVDRASPQSVRRLTRDVREFRTPPTSTSYIARLIWRHI